MPIHNLPGPHLTVAHSHCNSSALNSRQIQSQNHSALQQWSPQPLALNQYPLPSLASNLMPHMPPNTNSENFGSLSNESPSLRLDSAYQSSMGLQDFEMSQTLGGLTTMQGSTLQPSQLSQPSLSGAAGLRPQNLFHRDEMFQIYLQRPPPPSPRRQR